MSVVSIAFKVLLIIVSVASYLPQIQRIRQEGTCEGISVIYVLYNLIMVTEQLTLGFHLIVGNYDLEPMPGIVHNTPTLGDWLNLIQLLVCWVMQAVTFYLTVTRPEAEHRRAVARTGAVFIYTLFLLISLVPAIYHASLPKLNDNDHRSDDGRGGWATALFSGVHMLYISPLATALGIGSFLFQAWKMINRRDLGALSLDGLMRQEAVFAVVGLSWLFRLDVSDEVWRIRPRMNAVLAWYQLAGWAAVDNSIFATVQGSLVFIAVKREGRGFFEAATATERAMFTKAKMLLWAR